MSHKQQRHFCRWVRRRHGEYFRRVQVIDVGSLDINGNNRYLFSRSLYIGVDIVQGKNVDVVGKAYEVLPDLARQLEYKRRPFINTIISTEMLEHDATWDKSLQAMYDVLDPGGLLLITAAGDGRPEHGTSDYTPGDSPLTNNYYHNISNEMFASVLPGSLFSTYYLNQCPKNCDLQFYGIKKK